MELYKSITTNRWIASLTYEEAELVEDQDQDINKWEQANNLLYDEPAENNIAASNDKARHNQISQNSRLIGILISGLIVAIMVIFWSVTFRAIKDIYALALE
jgi:hypothetical protein